MVAGSQVWREYDRWNSALAEVVYPELEEPEPVYLDLEEDQLADLAERMGLPADEVETRLSRVVADTLSAGGPAEVLGLHVLRARQWRSGPRQDPPPFLGLLAVFCLAAKQMTASEGMAAWNYFGRLRAVLGRPADDKAIEQAYRRVAERLWGSLNDWLTQLDGRRGLPTAYALSYRYVGLTLSQTLVRKSDRDHLYEFFQRYGFAPGADVPPAELEPLLDAWITQDPPPVSKSLARLWQRGEAKPRIAQVAAVALARWDGSVRDDSGHGRGPRGMLALALEVGTFPRKRMAVQVLLYLPRASEPRKATVLTASPPAVVELVPEIQGALGLGRGSELRSEDVLEGLLQIDDSLTGVTLERRPRRMVLFRQDELTRRWIEAPQVSLGDDVTLLVHDALLTRLTAVLGVIARPGWEVRRGEYAGQPDGWALVTGVEVFSHPGELVKSGMDDLSPLIPLTTSQLKVAAGFALPGQVRGKWHSWRAPELRAVSDAPEGFDVRLVELAGWEANDEDVELERWHSSDGLVVADISELELEDGDYRVELLTPGTSEPLTATVVRLRSSDSPDARQWATAPGLAYRPDNPLGVLGVDEVGGRVVSGMSVVAPGTPVLHASPVPAQPWWRLTRSARDHGDQAVRLAMPDPQSCIYTGRHKELVESPPVDSQGRVLVAWYYGRCEGCGLVRRYPGRMSWFKKKEKERERARKAGRLPQHDVAQLVPVRREDDFRDWETALDALLHTGGGRWSSFERVALQLDPTALFVDQFSRSLESLGHVDIRRDPSTLLPTAWEVAPTVLAGTENGWFLSGYWPTSLWHQLAAALEEVGGRLVIFDQEGPESYFAEIDEGDLRKVLAEAGLDVAVEPTAWRRLAATLPALSSILDALPRSEASYDGDLTHYVPLENDWLPATDLHAVGAFRVRRFTTLDLVRSPRDVEEGTVARSTVQLSKHLAAQLTGQPPLVSYDPQLRQLVVPLGADLPALYGRAVVAASGRLPTPVPARRSLVYHCVPAELAQHVQHLLSH